MAFLISFLDTAFSLPYDVIAAFEFIEVNVAKPLLRAAQYLANPWCYALCQYDSSYSRNPAPHIKEWRSFIYIERSAILPYVLGHYHYEVTKFPRIGGWTLIIIF